MRMIERDPPDVDGATELRHRAVPRRPGAHRAGVDSLWRALPTFCRHNRFLENCPICSRTWSPPPRRRARARAGLGPGSAVRIRHGAGGRRRRYRDPLVPGLRASEDARRLGGRARLRRGAAGGARHVASGSLRRGGERAGHRGGDVAGVPHRLPVPGGGGAGLRRGRGPSGRAGRRASFRRWTAWPPGRGRPTTPAAGRTTLVAYRRWAERAGSQAAAFTGETHWDGARRFERAFERLALPGLHRAARFDLLVTLGRTGRYRPAGELAADRRGARGR